MNRRSWDAGAAECGGSVGFTLVELLVVIGIITVLVGILLPSLAKARASAQQTQCMSNLRQWGMGFFMYADANKGALPFDGPDGSGKKANGKVIGPGSGPPNGSFNSPTSTTYLTGINDPCLWYNAVPLYVNNKAYYDLITANTTMPGQLPKDTSNSIYVCPSAEPAGSVDTSDSETITNGYFMLNCNDPAVNGGTSPTLDPSYFSYVMNSQLFGTAANKVTYSAWKMSQLNPGPDCVLMMEKLDNNGEYLNAVVEAAAPVSTTKGDCGYNHSLTTGYTGWIGQPKGDWKRFTTRHRSGGNILYADGHVDWHLWTDVQILPNDPTRQITNPDGTSGNGNKPGVAIWNPFSAVN